MGSQQQSLLFLLELPLTSGSGVDFIANLDGAGCTAAAAASAGSGSDKCVVVTTPSTESACHSGGCKRGAEATPTSTPSIPTLGRRAATGSCGGGAICC